MVTGFWQRERLHRQKTTEHIPNPTEPPTQPTATQQKTKDTIPIHNHNINSGHKTEAKVSQLLGQKTFLSKNNILLTRILFS